MAFEGDCTPLRILERVFAEQALNPALNGRRPPSDQDLTTDFSTPIEKAWELRDGA